MPATEPQQNKAEDLQVKLSAVLRLIEEAEGLIQAQEQQVDRMRTSGLDCRHAQGLLEAYRASARIAIQEKARAGSKIGASQLPLIRLLIEWTTWVEEVFHDAFPSLGYRTTLRQELLDHLPSSANDSCRLVLCQEHGVLVNRDVPS